MCTAAGGRPKGPALNAETFNPNAGPRWTGWGQNTNNTRFQDAAGAGLTAGDVPKLKLKWAFAFPGDLQSYAQSTIAGGRVFVGSWGGKVYSLSAATGCIHWFFDAGQGVRSAISVGRVGNRDIAVFGDAQANLYALDAATGRLLWKTDVDDFPVGRISGSPTLYNGRIYVGIASGEEASGANPAYECCKFRGSVVAVDAADRQDAVEDATPSRNRSRRRRTPSAPSSGDHRARRCGRRRRSTPGSIASTSRPATTTAIRPRRRAMRSSRSIMDSGKILWSKQMTEKDAYTAACRLPDKTNCAESNGPDFDFSSSPILLSLANGRRMLVAGQKSGIVHALDPDKGGEVLWQTRVGRGGTMGGVQWGSAADQSNVYVALSDIGRVMLNYSNSTDADPKQGGGMFALRLEDGERVWYTPPPGCGTRQRCSPAQSAAVSAIPGVAFSGSVDGHMRAYSTKDGAIIWDFDTIRAYDTVNGVAGRGGSIDGPGPAIGGGMVFFNSGYPTAGGTPGNVLLAFSVDGK